MRFSLFGILLLATWSANSYAAENEDSPHELIIYYQYTVFLLKDSAPDPRATALRLLNEEYADFQIAVEFGAAPKEPTVLLTLIESVRDDYPPPGLDYLGYFGRGISRQEALDLQESDTALVFEFAYPVQESHADLKAATNLLHAVAVQHQGLIWDVTTREVFAPAVWKELRVDTWDGDQPSAADHVTIHSYKNTEYVRAITLGMQKFGQPDIVVNDFPWSSNRGVGSLINLVSQTLAEGATFNDDFSITLDARQIKHQVNRQLLVESLLSNARDEVTFQLRPAEHEEGDPDNFLLEVLFDGGEGNTVQERQESMLGALFGWEDSVTRVVHDDEILAASAAARKKLPELREAYNNGLEPGEYIHVKAPFVTTDGGNEWMWVEVMEWRGKDIRGLLMNEPFHVPELRAGLEVNIDQDDVFDYIRSYRDGRTEGNETGRLMMQQQAQ